MSCNACRVLRKGCGDSCVLRASIEWIEGPKSQGHATLFVAKFFGRAGLISSLSAVPQPNRPDLFRSLLYEACGRTINPVSGAMGLMWSGHWDMCEAAVETILRGGSLRPVDETIRDHDVVDIYGSIVPKVSSSDRFFERRNGLFEDGLGDCELGLCLMAKLSEKSNSEDSVMTSEDHGDMIAEERPALLNLF